MTLNILKLCVGADSVEDLHDWITSGRANWPRTAKRGKFAAHITRQMPKRAEELEGGSLYWVIRGHLCVRQPLVRLDTCDKEGVPHCALVMEKRLVLTRSRPVRAFQGWRYLSAADAPADLGPFVPGAGAGSESLRRELMELGLD